MSPLILISSYILDLLIGDPKWLPHPVRLFGKMIASSEGFIRRHFSNLKFAGGILAISLPCIAYLATNSIVTISTKASHIAGAFLSIILVWTTLSIKDLERHTRPIAEALIRGDLSTARRDLSRIVGRDTAQLGEPEIIRATVETIAEGSVDGIISPILFAALGGPALAVAYKAVNTLDSMVGYKNARYKELGWASAKLDEIANFIPAVLSGFILPLCALLVRRRLGKSASCVVRYGLKFPWQNSHIPESAMAGALGLRLGGLNYYEGSPVEKRRLGEEERDFVVSDIRDSMRIVYVASFITLLLGILIMTF